MPPDQRAIWLARASSLCLLLIFWTALVQHTTNPALISQTQIVIGSVVMFAGVVLRWLTIQSLAEHFVTAVVVRHEQPLLQSGLYRWVRHPSETGLLMVVLGAIILLASPLAAVLVLYGLFPMTLARLQHEDRHLAAGFGIQFDEYARRVKRLIPFVC